MEKLTRILAVAERFDEAPALLEKTVALARSFGAQIDLLVTEVRQMRELAPLCAERGYDEVMLISVHRGPEALADVILNRLQPGGHDLVVKTPAATHGQDHGTLHESDWRLANECPVPILLLRGQAWAQPTRFAVTLDVADTARARMSRGALHTAGFLAMGCRGNLDILYSESELEEETVRMERAVKVAQMVREFHVGCERLQMYSGAAELRLAPLISSRRYDVLVLALPREKDAGSEKVDGVARRLAAATHGDFALVRDSADTEARIAAWRRYSVRKQVPHEAQ